MSFETIEIKMDAVSAKQSIVGCYAQPSIGLHLFQSPILRPRFREGFPIDK